MIRRFFYGFMIFSLLMGNFVLPVSRAASSLDVVISEVAWAGSVDSSSDEWIELYNNTDSDIDLSGWSILDDGASSYDLSGVISAHGYFLIEDSEDVVNPNVANLIVPVSLANTGDSLVLYDDSSNVIDSVNSSGGAWFSGDATSHASMERIDLGLNGDDANNWGVSIGSGATASAGGAIIGTPGSVNSLNGGAVAGALVGFDDGGAVLHVGDSFVVDVNVGDLVGLFSYGFEVNYDPAVFEFVSAVEGNFLSEGGAVVTSFQAGLEDGVAGKLIVGDARTIDPKVGVDGNGTLVVLTFNVIGGEGSNSELSFASDGFLSGVSGDLSSSFINGSFSIENAETNPVSSLSAVEGIDRYAIKLSWDASSNATSYRVYRNDVSGVSVLIGETSDLSFVDSDGVLNGGFIVPNLSYHYAVSAVNNGVESELVLIDGVDSRGLKGDNNRSDRVDGRDLDNLAHHFAEVVADSSFDALVDTTYDGVVDGSDLIDIGANFALTY